MAGWVAMVMAAGQDRACHESGEDTQTAHKSHRHTTVALGVV